MSNPAQQRLDAMAKKKGFPSYAAMKAWNEKYRAPTKTQAPPKKKKNFLATLGDFHPMTWSSKRVTETLNKANKK